MFALEGLRSCLQDTSLPYGELLGNIWSSVDALEEEMDSQGKWFRIELKVRIMGVPSAIEATCYVTRTEHSGLGWDHGTCDIEFAEGHPGAVQHYGYRLNNGKIIATRL